MRYFMGIDVGTSGTKVVIGNEAGAVVASATTEYPLYQPQGGWAEQDPKDWREAVRAGVSQVLSKTGLQSGEIRGVGLTGQMHGLVMLDKNGEVLRPAILWCDQRTAEECEKINETVGAARYLEIAANPPLTGFTLPKILWVRKHEPEVYARCAHMMLPKDYIRFCLTGVFASDVSDASGTGLLDVRKRCWSKELLDRLDIPMQWLGRLYESHEITGALTEQAARMVGLKPGTPVIAGAGDNAAAAIGLGVIHAGDAFTSIGSSGVVFVNTADCVIHPEGKVHSFCSAVPGKWYVMGVTQAAGLSLKWFKETFGERQIKQAGEEQKDVYDLMTEMAARIAPGSDGLVYLPYLMGERTPHLDPFARGVFFGIQYSHTKAHFMRAVLEGVCFSLRDCVSAMAEMGVSADTMQVCGGGSKGMIWRQILTDVYGMTLEAAERDEGPALGAAILAGVGVGVYRTIEQGCDAFRTTRTRTQPSGVFYHAAYQLYRDLYRALKDCYRTS